VKRLLVVVILAAVLNLTLASPAFAWDPFGDSNKPGKMPDGPGNMPAQGRAALEHANDAMFGLAMGGGYGPVVAHAVNRFIRGEWWFTYYPPTYPSDPAEKHLIPALAPGIWRTWIFPY